MSTHPFKGTFDKPGPQNQWWRHHDVISQSISTKFCNFVCYTKRHHSAKFEQNRTRKKKLQNRGNGVILTSFLKIAHQFFVRGFFTHNYWCSKFQIDWMSDKGIIGVGTKHPPGWEWPKKPGQDRWTFQIFGGRQGRRILHLPPSLPSPLIFKAKFQIFVTQPS